VASVACEDWVISPACLLPASHQRLKTSVPHLHAALAVPVGLDGLRVNEACDANVEDLRLEQTVPHCPAAEGEDVAGVAGAILRHPVHH